MAQESNLPGNLSGVASGSFLDQIEPLIEFFNKVLNNQEFPKISKLDHGILDFAIKCYDASLKYKTSMTLPKLLGLEPELVGKVEALKASRGDDFITLLQHVVDTTNCFFEHSLPKLSQEQQPPSSISKALASPVSVEPSKSHQ
jgi:hypothetical protein